MKVYSALFLIISGVLHPRVSNLATQEQFDKEIIKSGKSAVIKFYADWCGPCQTAKEPFHSLASQSEFKELVFAQVNADSAPELLATYHITGLPTFLFFNQKGEQILKKTGLLGASDAKEFTEILTKTLKQLFTKIPQKKDKKTTAPVAQKSIWESVRTSFRSAYDWIQGLFG